MGMQSLKTKLRKRKYKLGFGRDNNEGPTNANAEWQFENFSPHIFAAKPAVQQEQDGNDDDDDDDMVVVDGGLASPPMPPPRCGIPFSLLPKRPSSWSPTSAPPVPPHAWQDRHDRQDQARAVAEEEACRVSSRRNGAVGGSNRNLKKDRDPESKYGFLDFNWSRSNTRRPAAAQAEKRPVASLKRVQSESGSDAHLFQPQSTPPKVEPVYSKPYRCKSGSQMAKEMRTLSNSRPARRPTLDGFGLTSPLAASESHLAASPSRPCDDDTDKSVCVQVRPVC